MGSLRIRRSLVMSLMALAGLFGMHGLADHGMTGMTGIDDMVAMAGMSTSAELDVTVAAVVTVSAHLPGWGDPVGGTGTMSDMAGMCLAMLLTGAVLLLVALAALGGLRRRSPWSPVLLAALPRGPARSRVPVPPDLAQLSVCRC